jgi:hypothetical protein
VFRGYAFAQNTPPPPPPQNEVNLAHEEDIWGERYFHFGLNFTPGIYWAIPNTSNNAANGASFGYGYGANLEFYFTRNYGIVLGLEVSELGAKYTNTTPLKFSNDSITNHDESIQYLQIPFMLKMKTVPFGNIRYFGLIGLDFGFLLKGTDGYNGKLYNPYSLSSTPYYGYFSKNNADIYSQTDFFRVSFVIGLGMEYQLAGSTALQASVTYNNCFTNLNNTSSNVVNMKGVELMFGVLF